MGDLKNISNLLNNSKLSILYYFFPLVVLSCVPQQPQPVVVDNRNPHLFSRDGDNRLGRRTRNPFAVSQSRRCSVTENSEICENDERCLAVCEDLFSNSRSREKCERLSIDTVAEFQNIFGILQDGGDIDTIKPSELGCLLSISDKEFLKEIRGLDRADSKVFFETVAAEEDFASILKRTDDNYKILEALLDNLGSVDEDRLENFAVDIDSGSTLMGLIAQSENEDAWDWAIEYVRNQCHDNESEYCDITGSYTGNDSQARELVFFCQILNQSDATKQEVRDILQLEFFESEYAEFIRRLGDRCGDNLNDAETPAVKAPDRECKPGTPDDFFKETSTASSKEQNNSVCYYLGGIAKD